MKPPEHRRSGYVAGISKTAVADGSGRVRMQVAASLSICEPVAGGSQGVISVSTLSAVADVTGADALVRGRGGAPRLRALHPEGA